MIERENRVRSKDCGQRAKQTEEGEKAQIPTKKSTRGKATRR